MKSNTPDLMKFKRLQRRLGEGTRGVVGLLEMLWLGTAKNTPRGDIGRFTNEEIAIMVDWDGDADALVAALVECGWLDEHAECRLVVHDWEQHAPQFVKGNVARHLGGFIQPSPKDSPKGGSLGQSQGTSPGEPPSKPSLTKPNQAKPNQEGCGEVFDRSPPAETRFPDFPCVPGRRTKERAWRLEPEVIARLSESFEGVDILAEARKAHGWLMANPHKRKTSGRMEDFLYRWISRENNRKSLVPAGLTESGSRVATSEDMETWRP